MPKRPSGLNQAHLFCNMNIKILLHIVIINTTINYLTKLKREKKVK